MAFALFGDKATARGALEEAELEEVGLVIIFDGGGFVAGEGGDGSETDGAVLIIFEHQGKHVAVGGVETEFVNFH